MSNTATVTDLPVETPKKKLPIKKIALYTGAALAAVGVGFAISKLAEKSDIEINEIVEDITEL